MRSFSAFFNRTNLFAKILIRDKPRLSPQFPVELIVPESQNQNIFAGKKTRPFLILTIPCSRNCGHHRRAQSRGTLQGSKNQLCSDPPDVVGEISSLKVVKWDGDALRVAGAEGYFPVADGLGSFRRVYQTDGPAEPIRSR